MSDEEIIKALECCIEDSNDFYNTKICDKCPLVEGTKSTDHLREHSLDLINRQRAEIEKLKNEIQITKDAYIMLQTKNEIIKSEAIKEFATRLEEYSYESMGNYGISRVVVSVKDIDNLVKEMISEQ